MYCNGGTIHMLTIRKRNDLNHMHNQTVRVLEKEMIAFNDCKDKA